jgi:hypothetical protein
MCPTLLLTSQTPPPGTNAEYEIILGGVPDPRADGSSPGCTPSSDITEFPSRVANWLGHVSSRFRPHPVLQNSRQPDSSGGGSDSICRQHNRRGIRSANLPSSMVGVEACMCGRAVARENCLVHGG